MTFSCFDTQSSKLNNSEGWSNKERGAKPHRLSLGIRLVDKIGISNDLKMAWNRNTWSRNKEVSRDCKMAQSSASNHLSE